MITLIETWNEVVYIYIDDNEIRKYIHKAKNERPYRFGIHEIGKTCNSGYKKPNH